MEYDIDKIFELYVPRTPIMGIIKIVFQDGEYKIPESADDVILILQFWKLLIKIYFGVYDKFHEYYQVWKNQNISTNDGNLLKDQLQEKRMLFYQNYHM